MLGPLVCLEFRRDTDDTPVSSMNHSRKAHRIVDLSQYQQGSYQAGRSFWVRSIWHVVNYMILRNDLLPFSVLRRALLRLFGAKIGPGVIMRRGFSVKFPWRLEIGAHAWIGERVWIDSLAPVTIGAHVCISQGAYLCTGNHDWADVHFGLITRPIQIDDGAWIGARAIVCPGVTVGTHAVLTAGSVATCELESYQVYSGNPAAAVRERSIHLKSSA